MQTSRLIKQPGIAILAILRSVSSSIIQVITVKLGSKCLKSACKTLIIWICSYLSHKVVYPNRRLSCIPQSFVLEQKGSACAKEHMLLLHVVEYPCRLFKYRLREREREKNYINLDFGQWSAKTLLICFCIEQIQQYHSVQCTITLLPAGRIIYLQVFQHSLTAVQLSTSCDLTRLWICVVSGQGDPLNF